MMPYSCAKNSADAKSADRDDACSPTILHRKRLAVEHDSLGIRGYLHIKLEEGIKDVDALGSNIFLAERFNLLYNVVGSSDRG